jgi:hypothetical protein
VNKLIQIKQCLAEFRQTPSLLRTKASSSSVQYSRQSSERESACSIDLRSNIVTGSLALSKQSRLHDCRKLLFINSGATGAMIERLRRSHG